jgi:hypothetical protein
MYISLSAAPMYTHESSYLYFLYLTWSIYQANTIAIRKATQLTFQITIQYLTSYNVPEDTTWFTVPSSIQPISLFDKYKLDVKGQFWKCFFFICLILLLDRYLKRKTVIYNLECQIRTTISQNRWQIQTCT